VWSADRPSTHHERPSGVADFFQISEHPARTSSAERRDVLNQHPAGSCVCDDSPHLKPQPGSFAREARALAGCADVLTGESAADEINPAVPGAVEGADVVVDGDVGPVLAEDGAAEGIDFAEGDGADADSLAGDGESSDAAEQIQGVNGRVSSQKPPDHQSRDSEQRQSEQHRPEEHVQIPLPPVFHGFCLSMTSHIFRSSFASQELVAT